MVVLSSLYLIFLLFTLLYSRVSSQSIRIRNTRQEFDICEGSSMRIICEVKDVRASVFYWFRCNDKCTVYSRLLPVINGEGSATVQDPITGLQITIDQAVLTGNRAISFNSTMIIDSSIYNKDPVQTFKCGRNNNPESNSFAIDYGLQSPRPPTPSKLIPTYSPTHEISKVTVTWRQVHDCSFEYTYIVDLITNSMSVERLLATSRNCNRSTEICHVDFDFRSTLDERYSVSLAAREINSDSPIEQDFLAIIDSSIVPTKHLNYSIVFYFPLCEFQFNCSHKYDSECTIVYRGISEYDTANCVQFTNYSYIITLGVSMYLDIRISGSLITSQVLDCGMANITAPELGQLSVESTLFGSVASYTCESDYILVGDEERTCSLNGWSGTQPECYSEDDVIDSHTQNSMNVLMLLTFVSVSLKLSTA